MVCIACGWLFIYSLKMVKSKENKIANAEIARVNKVNLVCVAAKLSSDATAKQHIGKMAV